MDNYNNMMNNEYAGIVYNNQMGDLTNQIQQQHQHHVMAAAAVEQQHQHQQSMNMMTSQVQPEMKDVYNSRESIIANNLQPQPHLGVYPHELQPESSEIPIQNHDQEMEQPVAFDEAPTEPAPKAPEEEEAEKKDEGEGEEEAKEDGAEKANISNNNEEKMETNDNEEPADKDEKKADGDNDDDDKKAEEEEKERVDSPKVELNIVERKKQQEEELNPNQCRVCTSTENLTDIFEFENTIRVCDIIMKICTNIRISEKDHLPHFICVGCVEKVKIAYEFKTTCENTDKELRKKMKRSQAKSRSTTEFVLINCPMSDTDNPDDEEEVQDDEEFKISESEESEPESDESFEPPSKKKRTPRKRPTPKASKKKRPAPSASKTRSKKKTPAKPPAKTPVKTPAKPSPGLKNIVFIEAANVSTSESDSDDDKPLSSKPKPKTKAPEVFNCTKCEKTFKLKHNLNQHLQKHISDDKKKELQKKQREMKAQEIRKKEQQKQKEHMEKAKAKQKEAVVKKTPEPAKVSAEKKKKPEPVAPAGVGRDLFKCVAPVTSTYWSDSYSE